VIEAEVEVNVEQLSEKLSIANRSNHNSNDRTSSTNKAMKDPCAD